MKPIPISKHRLRSIDEERLIDKPLAVRRRVISLRWRRKPNSFVVFIALAAIIAMLGATAYLIVVPI